MAGINSGAVPGTEQTLFGVASITPIDTYAPLTVHVQVRPGLASLKKCVRTIRAHRDMHDDALVSVSGISRDNDHILITLGIDLGDPAGVASGSPIAVAGYQFVATLFEDMFTFSPRYVPEPEASEREFAASLPDILDPSVQFLSDGNNGVTIQRAKVAS